MLQFTNPLILFNGSDNNQSFGSFPFLDQFSISEMMGVSPWYWWGDVPVKTHKALYVDAPPTYSKTPSVKYRGIFLNDEDWGLKPWAAKTFEKERGRYGMHCRSQMISFQTQ